MGCFLVMTETDFGRIKSSLTQKVRYLSQTSSGIFIEVMGDTASQTQEIASEIRSRFPHTHSDKMHRHHLIPQNKETREFFEKLGLDVHDYAVPIASKDHIGKSGIHNAEFRYNDYWSAFIEEHEGEPPDVILFHTMLCIKECMDAYNINFDTTVRFGKEK